jgi:hypothetical protein
MVAMIEQPFDHNGECRYCDELGMHRADCAWLVEQLRLLDVYRAGAEDAIKEIDRLHAEVKALQDGSHRLQAALVEAFYDPDPADPDSDLVYARVDWVGVVSEARAQIDKLKDALAVAQANDAAAWTPPEQVPATPHHVVVPLTRPEYFALRSLVAEHLLCPRRSEVYITVVPEHVEVTHEELLRKLMEVDG